MAPPAGFVTFVPSGSMPDLTLLAFPPNGTLITHSILYGDGSIPELNHFFQLADATYRLSQTQAPKASPTFTGTVTVPGELTLAAPVVETRVVGHSPIFDYALFVPGVPYGKLSATGTGGVVSWYLEIPDGVSLTSIVIDINPAGGHGALPATMPSITWSVLDLTTDAAVASTGGTQLDTSANVGTYEPLHSITLSGAGKNFPYTHDRTKNRVALSFSNEDNANAASGLQIVGIRATWSRATMGQD